MNICMCVGIYGVIVPMAKALGRELVRDVIDSDGNVLAYVGTKLRRLDCWVFSRCFGIATTVVWESPRVCKRFANRRSAAIRAMNRTR